MARIPGGRFLMGSNAFYPEERPVHSVTVDEFWMDEHAVTNDEFARFVAARGYVTVAERAPNLADYPGADPDLAVAGSLVFSPPSHRVSLGDFRAWWKFVPGACWKHPEGPASTLDGRGSHPVVHVAYEDAAAFAEWAGKTLPSEAEWEFAARGGLEGAAFIWGEEFSPGGRSLANTWQGEFPWQNLMTDGYAGTSPVGAYPPNGYGLYDMAGNVWEWTSDFYTVGHTAVGHTIEGVKTCCAPRRPDVEAGGHIPRRVLKGGSHLCAPNYCLRYRPAARQGEAIDSSACHIGFRCIMRGA